MPNGWNNDPNGMIYYDGVYHMFYQFNPAGNTWGNMHWGHATSTDMIHYKEEDVALRPDFLGAVYSGSAIVDYDNVTGLKEGVVTITVTAKDFVATRADDREAIYTHYYYNLLIKICQLYFTDYYTSN